MPNNKKNYSPNPYYRRFKKPPPPPVRISADYKDFKKSAKSANTIAFLNTSLTKGGVA